MCGDSTNSTDVETLMKGELADCVVTDPPYNVNVKNTDGLTIANDNMDSEKFFDFLFSAFSNLRSSLRPGGSFYIWYATKETLNFYNAVLHAGLTAKQELVWRKNSFTFGRSDYQWAHEPCIYGILEGGSRYFTESRKETTVFDDFPTGYSSMSKDDLVAWIKDYFENRDSGTMLYADKPVKDELHPTMKPLNLIATQIKNSTQSGELVLDLFGGSGSTMMAAEQLGRRCYMMEYDPRFVDVIIDRWQKFTGRKAIKVS